MFFAPPSKVPRTQRLTVTNSSAASYVYKRATEAQSGLPEAPPTSLDGAVLYDAANGCTMSVSSFLSGAGTRMCWLVDENKRFLRLWDVGRSGWQTAAPRLAEIPYFSAAKEGLPLFVCEMSGEGESLAFCSEYGAISTLDHSIEVQMIDEDDTDMTASCFVCARRLINAEAVTFTVVGTTAGVLVVDLKYGGVHTTVKFDRRDPSSFRWARGGHNNLPQYRGNDSTGISPSALPGVGAEEEENPQRLSNEDSQMRHPVAAPNSTNWLWHSLKSLVAGSSSAPSDYPDRSAAAGTSQRSTFDATGIDEGANVGTGESGHASSVWPFSMMGLSQGRRGGSPLAFTQVKLRGAYPEQVVAISAAGEVFLLDLGAIPPPEPGTVGQPGITIKWATSLPTSLGRNGHIVACAESRHKVCLLYYVRESPVHHLPALWLVTLDAALGKVVNHVVLNAVSAVISVAARLPPHHIKIYADDGHRQVIIVLGAYVLRVNNQVGVRQPCSSEDTLFFNHLERPIVSTLREDGSLITLDAHGPHLMARDVTTGRLRAAVDKGNRIPLHNGDNSGESELKNILDAVRTDSKLSLDSAILYASESISASSDWQHQRYHGGKVSDEGFSSGTGNWARRNLNVEDENIVLRVTHQLTSQQQAHRCFVMAVLNHEEARSQLSPTTIAQLLSVQEALVSLCALRSMQNVGLQAQQSFNSDKDDLMKVVLPSVYMMRGMSQGGNGAYLLQRRPSRHDLAQHSVHDASRPPTTARLVKNTEQMERCQQIMRRAIVAVANTIRAEYEASPSGVSTGLEGNVQGLTAAEICFANPWNLVRLLRFLEAFMSEVRQSVSLTLEEKFSECYAAGCIYVIVAQTVVESREDVRKIYPIPDDVLSSMWTGSTDAVSGVAFSFSQACVHLSTVLADVCNHAPHSSSGDGECQPISIGCVASAVVFGSPTLVQRYDMLDVVGYLMYFSLAQSFHHDSRFVSSAMTSTLLREPFVSGPVGYPYGAPTASRCCSEIGRRVLTVCETLALRFDAMEVLMIYALSTPVGDPASCPEMYERLQRYCQQNSFVLDAALQTLWEQRREWELLSLPTVLPGCPDARARRNSFLETQAPHLLWLADPGRYDALTAEGQANPAYIPYGEDQLNHRSRCNALARLAWVAGGAAPSSRVNDMQLSESIVAAQQQFLAPNYNAVTLGPQATVQRLLEISDCVAAWVQAALIASHTVQPTCEDLLVQVLRRCRTHDGESRLQNIFTNSVSELETDASLRKTALGQALMACARLHDAEMLHRICETLLTSEELKLLSSWLVYLWTVSHERA